MLPRADPMFVKALFKLYVPEIQQQIVEIGATAREAGRRTKIAVWSRDDGIDPVGACVGLKGSRVQAVVNELNGERIDIVPWSSDPERFAKLSLAPARVARVFSDPESKTIQAIVDEDHLSLATGRNGQNGRLAAGPKGRKPPRPPRLPRPPRPPRRPTRPRERADCPTVGTRSSGRKRRDRGGGCASRIAARKADVCGAGAGCRPAHDGESGPARGSQEHSGAPRTGGGGVGRGARQAAGSGRWGG